MKKQPKSMLVLAVMAVFMATVLFSPGLIGAGELEPTGPPTTGTMYTLEEIYQIVTPLPTGFVLWENNPRFAVWDRGTQSPNDDAVLDRSTGLMWTRHASLFGDRKWQEAMSVEGLFYANRTDWRLPSIEELVTLYSPGLPVGHPFVHVVSGYHWSSTLYNPDIPYYMNTAQHWKVGAFFAKTVTMNGEIVLRSR